MNRWYAALYLLVRPFFCLFHPGKLIGGENIPPGGVLICANHSDNLDPLYIVFALGLRRLPRILAKEELRRIPIVGFLLDKIGLIWVKRGQNDIAALRKSLKALKDGETMLIFPEGTRSEEVSEGKTGAAMLAIRAGVPVLPLYLPQKKRWFRRTPVVAGEPYLLFTEARKPNSEDYRIATEELMRRIAALGETL